MYLCWAITPRDSTLTWQGLASAWSAGAERSPHLRHRTDSVGLEPVPIHPPSITPAHPDPVLAGGLRPGVPPAQYVSHLTPPVEMLAVRGLVYQSRFCFCRELG